MIFSEDGFVRTRRTGEVGFAEKHGNIGVLAGFVLFLAGMNRRAVA